MKAILISIYTWFNSNFTSFAKLTNWIFTAKDEIYNFFLVIYSFFDYYIFKILNKKKSFTYPSGIKFQYTQDFTKMTVDQLASLYNKRLWWGDFDPTNPQTFQDPNGVVLNSNGLNLLITNATQIFNGITVNHGRGIVQSNVIYKYGFFEFNVILPTGPWTWCALWLETDPLPGEIDFLECFPNAEGNYGRNINTNVHISEAVNEINLDTTHGGWFIDSTKPLNVKIYWSATEVKIWFNNFIVRIIRNKYNLAYFNTSAGLSLIMNNQIQEVIEGTFTGNPFIVQNFSYYSI